MATRDSSYLKSRFENGDKPDQDDFGDLIDTLFDGTIWHSTLVVPIRGVLLVDNNTPQHSLVFQVDVSTSPTWASFVVRADSSVDNTNWEFWNGVSFLQLDLSGLHPSYQNVDYGLVTYTYTSVTPNVGMRGNIYYIRYRSGFNYVWSDYQVNKVVLG